MSKLNSKKYNEVLRKHAYLTFEAYKELREDLNLFIREVAQECFILGLNDGKTADLNLKLKQDLRGFEK